VVILQLLVQQTQVAVVAQVSTIQPQVLVALVL